MATLFLERLRGFRIPANWDLLDGSESAPDIDMIDA
jgi:hypothetical protein